MRVIVNNPGPILAGMLVGEGFLCLTEGSIQPWQVGVLFLSACAGCLLAKYIKKGRMREEDGK